MGESFFFPGNIKNLDLYMDEIEDRDIKFNLIINGTPYPTFGSVSSDAPERKNFQEGSKKKDDTFNYKIEENFGNLKIPEYWDTITETYKNCCKYLVKGGKFILIIKDLVRNKKAYPLHKYLIDHLLLNENSLKYYGSYIHYHYPPTLFMSTYNKRFPEVKIPLYQTAIILEKN
jgi:hypothetical protein